MNPHKYLTLYLTFFTFAGEAFAWGPEGHRITAEIAERNLTQAAFTAIRAIIGEQSLAELATWPDEIRNDPAWDFAKSWHFLSIDDEESWDNYKHDSEGDVVTKLQEHEKILRDPSVKPADKRNALAFFVHLVGDVHQPLHVGRRADLGGNKIQVVWFDEKNKLHEVWDERIIESFKLSYTEFATFLNRVMDSNKTAWQASSYLDWARESKDLRKQVYDYGEQKANYYLNIQDAPVLGYPYQSKAQPIVKDRLQKGGIRLAGKLNEIFSK